LTDGSCTESQPQEKICKENEIYNKEKDSCEICPDECGDSCDGTQCRKCKEYYFLKEGRCYKEDVIVQPVDPEPVDPIPVDPIPVDPKPVDPKPVDPIPVDPKPVDPIPVDPIPVDPIPVDPEPVDPIPVEPPKEPEPGCSDECDFCLETPLLCVVELKFKIEKEGTQSDEQSLNLKMTLQKKKGNGEFKMAEFKEKSKVAT
jgi:hypothetical protein